MLEISNDLLNNPKNRFLIAHKDESLNNVLARLIAANGKDWWHLIIDWGNGEFRAVMFAELAKQLTVADPNKVFEQLTDFNLPLAKTVDKYSLGTSAALKLARQQPNGLIVVTHNGAPIGLIFTGGTRSADDGFTIMNYYVANVTNISEVKGKSNIAKEDHFKDIDTAGAYVEGNVNTDGDFVGRDKMDYSIKIDNLTIYQSGTGKPATKPVASIIEEAIRLDVAAPESALLGETFYLAVAVRQPDSLPLDIKDLQTDSVDGVIFYTEDDKVIRYRIEVQGAGFEVAPPHQILKLRPEQNSIPCFFQITSRQSGQRSLTVTASQDDESLAAQTRINILIEIPVQST
jgi:hypothetical protein